MKATAQIRTVRMIEPTRVKRAMLKPLRGLHAVPEIPDQVAHAAQHVVHEHPGIAEEDQVPEGRAEEPLHRLEGPRAGGKRHEPHGEERDAHIQGGAGGAMEDGHRHGPAPSVDLKMRRRGLGAGFHLSLKIAPGRRRLPVLIGTVVGSSRRRNAAAGPQDDTFVTAKNC
jgi:hypothetical protein